MQEFIIKNVDGRELETAGMSWLDVRENIAEWFPDAPVEVIEQIDELADRLDDGESIAGPAEFLRLTIEETADEEIPMWPASYRRLISDDSVRFLARCGSEDSALTKSGEIARATGQSTVFLRLAFIQHVQGRAAVEQAETAFDEAEDSGDPKEANAAVRDVFLAAWRVARERWIAERRDVLTGVRMAGQVMRAIRESLGLTQDDLAARLNVAARTIRAWESGEALANAGASSELWQMWDTFKDEALTGYDARSEFVPSPGEADGCVAYPSDTDSRVLRVAVAAYPRVTIMPASETRTPWEDIPELD